jgi:chromosome segregation ATPase
MKDNCSKWGEAIEKTLGRMMSAFVVTNAFDQRALIDIMKRHNCDIQHTVVCQGRDNRYNVPSIPNAITVCDAVTIDEAVVFNCLVDQTRMDQTILVNDEDDCRRYFGRSNGLDGFSDNRIKSACTARGTKIQFKAGNQVRLTCTQNYVTR